MDLPPSPASSLDSSFDDRDKAQDRLKPLLNGDIEETIRRGKSKGMFVSGWEQDDEGIREKNMNDVVEQLLTAAENNDVVQMKVLLSRNPNLIKAHDADGYTALHRAAYNNNVESVQFLLSSGADAEACTEDGWTALHSASNWACYETVGVLLSHGVNVNCCTKGNLTPLHLAVSSQEDAERAFHTVRYLLQAPGIDPSVKSNAGDTPVMLARRAPPQIFEIVNDYLRRR